MAVLVGLVSGFALAAQAAILVTEDFEAGANGWTDRDLGEMAVTHQPDAVTLGNGAMQGVFASQMFAFPQTDAFVINTGTDFLGDFTGLTGITLDLYAQNVLPSDATLRLISGSDTFFYTLNLAVMSVGGWTPYAIPLAYAAGWQGGEAAFNAALLSVDQVEVQLTRNGQGAQTFFLDNIGTSEDDFGFSGGGGGGPSAVPEPSSVTLMFLVGVAVLYFKPRRWHGIAGTGGAR